MSEPDPDPDPRDRPTVAPFLGALVIIVAAVIAVWLFNVFDDDGPTADQLVGRAVAGQNDALQRADYAAFRTFTCAAQQSDEARVLSAQRDSVAKHGQRVVDSIGTVTVTGDRATAEVTYYFDKNREAKQTTQTALVREGGAWKVCSTGPS
jgi:hypothetical protein